MAGAAYLAWLVGLFAGPLVGIIGFVALPRGLARVYLINSGQIIASLAAWLLLQMLARDSAVRVSPRTALWRDWAAGALCWLLGNTTYAVLQVGFNLQDFPGWQDPLFLLAYWFFLRGLLRLPGRPADRSTRIDQALEAAALLLGTLVVGWDFKLHDTLSELIRSPGVAAAYPLLYPLCDVALLGLLGMRFRQLEREDLSLAALAWLTIGVFALIMADFSLPNIIDSVDLQQGGALADLGWGFFSAFWGLAALAQLRRTGLGSGGRASGARRLPPATLVLVVTYCWLSGLAVLLIRSLLTPGTVHQPGLLAAGLLGIIALVGIRQVREVLSNASLNQALREVADSREQFRRLFQLFPDAALLTRMDDGLFVEVNEGFTRLYGYAYAECVGRSALELGLWVNPTDRKTFMDELARVGVILRREGRARRRDGTEITVELSARVLEIGGRLHVLNLVRDLTEKKQVEERLRRSEHELHRAQRLEAIGTLAGGIAHDFNNLLTAIMGGIELVGMDLPPDSAARAGLDRTLAASRRARDLVRQILLLSRRQERPSQPADVAYVVDEVVRFVQPGLPAGASMRTISQGPVPPVLGDATQLHQVLLNLCTNAVQAVRDQPGALIEVATDCFRPDDRFLETHPTAERREYVRIAVRDNGCGMPPEVMSHIFEPFFTTKRGGAGTGLGLAVVHGVVHNHGGLITVESRPGAGSTFTVLLPAAAGAAPSDGSHPGLLLEGRGEEVLVVDDDTVVEDTLREMLLRLGYRPVTFSQPEAAVEFMSRAGADVRAVVTDFSMGTMDGIAVATQIKSTRPRLPVVLLSGYLTGETLERARTAGIEHLLDKPIMIEELARVLAECLAADRR